ncbi:hypothetical protein KC19_5G198000 [Ceratodon purpureus]|uniref:ribose-5-phosphate isomerase n=1 Tax=Ceratodon purpureus TaxID=3225 RepID=A0A8T0I662_CERPU|nr:hypothetical protein KC19_5G198000 [Ceratodon purpureus]
MRPTQVILVRDPSNTRLIHGHSCGEMHKITYSDGNMPRVLGRHNSRFSCVAAEFLAMALLRLSLPLALPSSASASSDLPPCMPSSSGRAAVKPPQLPHLRASVFFHGTREGLLHRRQPVAVRAGRMEGSALQVHSSQNYLQDAARQTVDYFVKSGMAVGLGTGFASGMAIDYIGEKLRSGSLRDIVCVPMSSSSAAAAAQAGVPLQSFEEQPQLDIVFDDADIVQEGTLFSIIGRKGVEGRQSILKEKAIMKAAKQMVFIINESQFVGKLEGAVPVLIQQENWLEVAEEIDDMFLGDAEVWRRPSFGEAGPLGGDNPLVSPEGHFVLDVIFTTPIANAAEMVENLESIPGVMGHGLVMDAAYGAAVAGPAGVKIRTSLFKAAFTSME